MSLNRNSKKSKPTYRRSKTLRFRDEQLSVYRPGSQLVIKLSHSTCGAIVAETTALYGAGTISAPRTEPIKATPSAELQRHADGFISKTWPGEKIGFGCASLKNPADGRNLRESSANWIPPLSRSSSCLGTLRVFNVTDSEYMQQMLASHFPDSKVLPKKSPRNRRTGPVLSTVWYRAAMRTTSQRLLPYRFVET